MLRRHQMIRDNNCRCNEVAWSYTSVARGCTLGVDSRLRLSINRGLALMEGITKWKSCASEGRRLVLAIWIDL